MKRSASYIRSIAFAVMFAFAVFAGCMAPAEAGFNPPPNAPQITVQTPAGAVTYAIDVEENAGSPIGDLIGIYLVQNSGGEWLNVGPGAGFYQTLGGPAGLLSDINAAGGLMIFTNGITVKINAFLSTIAVCAASGCASTPSSPPATLTAANALSSVQSAVAAQKLQVVNGVLILQ